MSSTFWASYLSGALGILVGNRLDVLKVQAQAGLSHRTPPLTPPTPPASPNLPSPITHPTSTTSTPSHRLRLSHLTAPFRGAAAPILGYGALNSILFLTFNRTLKLLEPDLFSYTKLAGCSLGNIWLAGALGGLATWIVSAPSEVIKCRAQLQVPSTSSTNTTTSPFSSSSSSWAITKHTLQTSGIRGLFRGGLITSARDAIGYGWYFWSYELSKRLLVGRRTPDWWAEMQAWEVLIAGGVAGVITWGSVYPLDVVKTRVQCWTPSTAAAAGEREALLGADRRGGQQVRRPGTWEVVKEVWKEGGIRAFYRGIGVCSLRAFLVNAVQWYTYEKVMGWLGQQA